MISIKRSTSRISTGGGGQRSLSSFTNTRTTRCGKCCYYFRQVTTFLFSHIGLCTLLLGYALVGAFTFQALESKHEQQQRIEMRKTRDQMIKELSIMTNQSHVLKYDNWTERAEKILKTFELKFLNAVKYKGYDGHEELSKTSSQWSFSGALLYSIIVITTIGYGNVAPRTDWGKIVTILYAIIGIPLMLFCLSNIGHTMAHSFKFIYWKCCCYLCVKPKKERRQKRRRIRRQIRKHRRTQQRAANILMQRSMTIKSMGNHFQQSNLFEQQQHQSLSRSNSSNRSDRIAIDGQSNQLTITDQTNTPNQIPSTPIRTPILNFFQQEQQKRSPTINHENNNKTDNNKVVQNTLQLPKRILSRSLSARYHNELRNNKRNGKKTQKNFNQKNPSTTKVPLRKTTMNVPPVICNIYASCSDEFIDMTYRSSSMEDQERQLNKTASQVRFQPHSLRESSSSNIPPPPSSPLVYSTSINLNQNQPYQRSISVIEPPTLSLSLQSPLLPPPPPPPLMIEMNHFPSDSSGFQSFPHQTMLFNIEEHLELPDQSDLSCSDSDDSDEIQEKNIPITVCLALVISYICGGAWFFSTSEDWTFLDASYFCFITLSTIGFGDLVPGRTVLSTPEDGQMTLAICALYLLFGMALLAMSLNLVKEKVLETVRIIGERIGILVSDDDEDYY